MKIHCEFYFDGITLNCTGTVTNVNKYNFKTISFEIYSLVFCCCAQRQLFDSRRGTIAHVFLFQKWPVTWARTEHCLKFGRGWSWFTDKEEREDYRALIPCPLIFCQRSKWLPNIPCCQSLFRWADSQTVQVALWKRESGYFLVGR